MCVSKYLDSSIAWQGNPNENPSKLPSALSPHENNIKTGLQ
ncbi:hypothetical protein CSC28_3748 [Pseudomonas paraeruginosa]|nr:hypothetical protein CSC28_3748 [Pseudomonas paraeruginosa]